MPYAFELPGMLRSVVPLMRGERPACPIGDIVDELVVWRRRHSTHWGRLTVRNTRLMPGLSAVVRALHELPEPARRLRSVDALGIHGRAFHVVDLPAPEERP